MTPEAEPETSQPGHEESTEFAAVLREEGSGEPAAAATDLSLDNHAHWTGNAAQLAPQEDSFAPPVFFEASLPRLIPHLGHVLLFFVIALLVMAVGQALGLVLLQKLHLFGHRSFQALFRLSESDARVSLPVQAFSYALVALVVIPVFSLLWKEPFGLGVHWNAKLSRKTLLVLAAVGIASGFGIGAFGSLLPMPKDPPIMQDMMKSPIGAWMMLVFGVSAAPLLEELAFRGFLLPGLINGFRWLARKSVLSEASVRWIGIPASVLITSAGFAFLHSPQVSHAWGPLILIGMVSIVLCLVRLTMNSVAAGVVVHAMYNLTLFAGVLAETGGFRHLEKLTT
jgi:membrane protease YdiL (CAAX protease family)